MRKFDYDDIVQVRATAVQPLRAGAKAWIVGVHADRKGAYFDRFAPGTVYSIEYEDGSSAEAHESDLFAGISEP